MLKNLRNTNSPIFLIIIGVILFLAFILISFLILNSSFFSSTSSSSDSKNENEAKYTTPEGKDVYYDSSYYSEDDVQKIIEEKQKYPER